MANNENLIPVNSETAAALGRKGGLAKKGSKHITTWVQEIIEDPNFEAWITNPKTGVELFKGVPLQAMIRAQLTKAINGDTKAYDSLVKSGYVPKTEVENSGEQTITIVTRKYGKQDES